MTTHPCVFLFLPSTIHSPDTAKASMTTHLATCSRGKFLCPFFLYTPSMVRASMWNRWKRPWLPEGAPDACVHIIWSMVPSMCWKPSHDSWSGGSRCAGRQKSQSTLCPEHTGNSLGGIFRNLSFWSPSTLSLYREAFSILLLQVYLAVYLILGPCPFTHPSLFFSWCRCFLFLFVCLFAWFSLNMHCALSLMSVANWGIQHFRNAFIIIIIIIKLYKSVIVIYHYHYYYYCRCCCCSGCCYYHYFYFDLFFFFFDNGTPLSRPPQKLNKSSLKRGVVLGEGFIYTEIWRKGFWKRKFLKRNGLSLGWPFIMDSTSSLLLLLSLPWQPWYNLYWLTGLKTLTH